MKTRNVPAVKCPQCKKEAPVVHFGNGYIAVCCGKIIYRGDRPPEQKDKKCKIRSTSNTKSGKGRTPNPVISEQ